MLPGSALQRLYTAGFPEVKNALRPLCPDGKDLDIHPQQFPNNLADTYGEDTYKASDKTSDSDDKERTPRVGPTYRDFWLPSPEALAVLSNPFRQVASEFANEMGSEAPRLGEEVAHKEYEKHRDDKRNQPPLFVPPPVYPGRIYY
jgi:hypothetical protein